VTLGLCPIEDYINLPIEEMQFKFRKETELYLKSSQYIIGSKTDLLINNIDTNNIILHQGKYYLVKK